MCYKRLLLHRQLSVKMCVRWLMVGPLQLGTCLSSAKTLSLWGVWISLSWISCHFQIIWCQSLKDVAHSVVNDLYCSVIFKCSENVQHFTSIIRFRSILEVLIILKSHSSNNCNRDIIFYLKVYDFLLWNEFFFSFFFFFCLLIKNINLQCIKVCSWVAILHGHSNMSRGLFLCNLMLIDI